MLFGRKLLRCSFCGKDQTQVSKLVASPRLFICDVCTAAAARIIDGSNENSPPPAPQAPRARSVLVRAWRWLRGPLHRTDGRAITAACGMAATTWNVIAGGFNAQCR